MKRNLLAVALLAALLGGAPPAPAQIELAADVISGPTGSQPAELISWNGHLYFRGIFGSGHELIRFDGSQFTAININPVGGSHPQDFIDYAGALYFQANDGTHGEELMRWNGVAVTPITDIVTGSGSSYAEDPVVYDGKLHFVSTDTTDFSQSIYSWDGADVTQETQSGDVGPDQTIRHLTVFENEIYFAGNPTGADRDELWRWDGANAVQVSNFNPTQGGGVSDPFLVWNGWLWFRANSDAGGREIWRYNGSGSPIEVTITPGPSGSQIISDLAVYDDELYILAKGNVYRVSSPGSSPQPVATLFGEGELGVGAGRLFISAGRNPQNFTQRLFSWDGSILQEFILHPQSLYGPEGFAEFQGQLHFGAYASPNVGGELYRWIPPEGSARIPVGGSGVVDFGTDTGVDIDFSGVARHRTPGTCTVERWADAVWNPQGILESQRSSYHWIVTASDSLAFDASTEVRFRISEIPEAGITDPAAIQVYRRDLPDTAGFFPVTTSYDSGAGEIVATGFTEFGEFVFASNTALSVEVLVLYAAVVEEGVRLSWTGAAGTELDDYDVERSTRRAPFARVPVLDDGGPHDPETEFHALDRDAPLGSESLRYRVARGRGDGRVVSDPVEVRSLPAEGLRVHGVFPNPFVDRATLEFDLGRRAELSLTLHDVRGRRVATLLEGERPPGSYRVLMEGGDLPAGVYFYRLEAAGRTRTGRILRIR